MWIITERASKILRKVYCVSLIDLKSEVCRFFTVYEQLCWHFQIFTQDTSHHLTSKTKPKNLWCEINSDKIRSIRTVDSVQTSWIIRIMNIKISYVVVCVLVSVLLFVGVFTIFMITRNHHITAIEAAPVQLDEEETTTLTVSVEEVFQPFVVIEAPKVCKEKERYDPASKTCRKVYWRGREQKSSITNWRERWERVGLERRITTF